MNKTVGGQSVQEVRKNMLDEARGIIEAARKDGILLRLMGGLAVRMHCTSVELCDRDYSDIDMVGLSKQRKRVMHLFEILGYTHNYAVAHATGGRQLQFYKECTHMNSSAHFFIHPDDHVDVFMDTFKMDHDIDVRNRLTIEDYTLSVSDILITKLQIHRLNEKDVRDILTIMKDLPLGNNDEKKMINTGYIARLCARNWGLYQDVVANIAKCVEGITRYSFTDTQKAVLESKLVELRRVIEGHPKSLLWKTRAYFGNTFVWYREIEDQSAGYPDLDTQG
jgi:hypothetical protein